MKPKFLSLEKYKDYTRTITLYETESPVAEERWFIGIEPVDDTVSLPEKYFLTRVLYIGYMFFLPHPLPRIWVHFCYSNYSYVI